MNWFAMPFKITNYCRKLCFLPTAIKEENHKLFDNMQTIAAHDLRERLVKAIKRGPGDLEQIEAVFSNLVHRAVHMNESEGKAIGVDNTLKEMYWDARTKIGMGASGTAIFGTATALVAEFRNSLSFEIPAPAVVGLLAVFTAAQVVLLAKGVSDYVKFKNTLNAVKEKSTDEAYAIVTRKHSVQFPF
jgi:hypothetical protein